METKVELTEGENIYKTPPIYTEGNKIKQKDTGKTLILRGAASDTFRHRKGKYDDIKELLRRLDILSEAGGNLITFWITDDGIKERYDLADTVVDFANKKGVYIIFAPLVGIEPPVDKERPVMNRYSGKTAYDKSNQPEMENLMSNLALRYKDYPNVIYGVGAEPVMDWNKWAVVAAKMISVIREVHPDSVVFVPGGSLGREIGWPLSDSNIIYGTEQYLAYNEIKLKELLESPNYTENYTWQNPHYIEYPLLISEMGGTIGADFGNRLDLEVIDRMLTDLEIREFSYQIHSIDTYGEWVRSDGSVVNINGLGMFNKDGDLTAKGKLTIEHLKRYPGTKVGE